MSHRDARRDLLRCLSVGSVSEVLPSWVPPSWHRAATDPTETTWFVMLGDDVLLVVYPDCEPPTIATVMTPYDHGGVHAAELSCRRYELRMKRKPPRPPLRDDPGWRHRQVGDRRDRSYRLAS